MNLGTFHAPPPDPHQQYVAFVLQPDRQVRTRKVANQAYYALRVLGFYDSPTAMTEHSFRLKEAGYTAFNFIHAKIGVFMDVFSLLNPRAKQRVIADRALSQMLGATSNPDYLATIGLEEKHVDQPIAAHVAGGIRCQSNVAETRFDLDADPLKYAPPLSAWPDNPSRYALFSFLTTREHAHRTPQMSDHAAVIFYGGFPTVRAANEYGTRLNDAGYNAFTVMRVELSQYALLPWLSAGHDPDGSKAHQYLALTLRARLKAFNESNDAVRANTKEYKDPQNVAEFKANLATLRSEVHTQLRAQAAGLQDFRGTEVPMTVGDSRIISREEYDKLRATGSVIDDFGGPGAAGLGVTAAAAGVTAAAAAPGLTAFAPATSET